MEGRSSVWLDSVDGGASSGVDISESKPLSVSMGVRGLLSV